MKPLTLLLVSALCLTSVGCGYIYGPVEEVKALMEAKAEAIQQISKKLEADPTAAGVDEARKVVEAKKGDLKAKRDAIYAKPGGKNYDWKTTLNASEARDDEAFDAIISKFFSDCAARQKSYLVCTDESDKLRKLKDDFNATIR